MEARDLMKSFASWRGMEDRVHDFVGEQEMECPDYGYRAYIRGEKVLE